MPPIAGKAASVAHRFGAGLLPGGHHGGMLRPSSVVVEGAALPAQMRQRLPGRGGPDPRWCARRSAPARRRPTRPTKSREVIGQGPEQLLVVLPGDHRGGVRLFVVAAHLGDDLVEGYPHRDRQAQLLPQHPAEYRRPGPLASPPKRWREPVISSQLVSSMEEGSAGRCTARTTALTRPGSSPRYFFPVGGRGGAPAPGTCAGPARWSRRSAPCTAWRARSWPG